MKLLHTDQNINDWPGLKVFRVEFETIMTYDNVQYIGFAELKRELRKFTMATWGFSEPTLTAANRGSSYFFFEDESDLLVFKLRLNRPVSQIHLWPAKTRFTVYEFVTE